MALMVGGSQDGKVIETRNTPAMEGWEAPKPGLDPDTGIVWGRRVQYRQTTVSVFGVTMSVFIQEGWPEERIEATLAANLLSDLARQLADQ